MRAVLPGVIFLAAGLLLSARPLHRAASEGAPFKVAGLSYAVPERWQPVAFDSSVRAGQWRIAPPRGQPGDPVEIVVYFFGPGIGGSVSDNLNAWASLVATGEGKPAPLQPAERMVNGHRIVQVLLTGTYTAAATLEGVPSLARPGYALLGTAVENPAGNIYWQVSGPAAAVAAFAPEFEKIVDGAKPSTQP